MLLAYGFCTAAISFTITTTSVFSWLREWLGEESKLGELVHCPWCLGHYIALVLVAIDPNHLLPATDFVIIQQAVSWFTVMGIAGLLHFVLLRAYKPVQEAAMMRARERKQNQKPS